MEPISELTLRGFKRPIPAFDVIAVRGAGRERDHPAGLPEPRNRAVETDPEIPRTRQSCESNRHGSCVEQQSTGRSCP